MRHLDGGKLDRRGFTLIEIVIAVAIVAVFASAISPMVFKHLESAKVSKAQNETETIATAIMTLYKDVYHWPQTNANGPSGTVDRVLTSTNVVTTVGAAVTGVGAALSVVGLLMSGSDEGEASSTATIEPTVGLGALGIRGSF